jgi:hypothetical protein
MRKLLTTIGALLLCAAVVWAGNLVVRSGGPSGQGNVSYQTPDGTSTGLVFTTTGTVVNATLLYIGGVQVTASAADINAGLGSAAAAGFAANLATNANVNATNAQALATSANTNANHKVDGGGHTFSFQTMTNVVWNGGANTGNFSVIVWQ